MKEDEEYVHSHICNERTPVARIWSPLNAMRYCTLYCNKRGQLGCAYSCELRKRFHIPPFGDAFPIHPILSQIESHENCTLVKAIKKWESKP